ncbi:MAG: DUF4296 domain-containing protein [Hyphomicrobiales bacterium]
MKRFWVFILLILIIYSCSDKVSIPKGVIPPDKMTNIMIELQIADAAISFRKNRGLDFEDYQSPYYQYVFNKYDVDASLFKESMAFYDKNPKILEQMYQNVKDSLSLKIKEIEPTKDSLQISPN